MEQKIKKIKVRYAVTFEHEIEIPDNPTFTSDDIINYMDDIIIPENKFSKYVSDSFKPNYRRRRIYQNFLK